MKKKRKITKGSLVRNSTTREIGVVIEVIGCPDKPFGYLIRTKTGKKRWIIRYESFSSKPS